MEEVVKLGFSMFGMLMFVFARKGMSKEGEFALALVDISTFMVLAFLAGFFLGWQSVFVILLLLIASRIASHSYCSWRQKKRIAMQQENKNWDGRFQHKDRWIYVVDYYNGLVADFAYPYIFFIALGKLCAIAFL